MKILFAASEAHPLIKTGGLADVAGSLPKALQSLSNDVRVVLPAYPEAIAHAGTLQSVATISLPGSTEPVSVLAGTLPDSDVILYLIDAPACFKREGNPYVGPDGLDWPDNAARFALFSRAVAALAGGQVIANWKPDAVHCNDWQTGLIPPLLAEHTPRPASIFTIHNLAYQGLFTRDVFDALELPQALWSVEAMEFHQQFSFIKGGLVFADRITTVSPTYADEICSAEMGMGLEGLLAHRAAHLSGILNGVDYDVWDPAHDEHIAANYDSHTVQRKHLCKKALQAEFGLPDAPRSLLFGHIGRLVSQKGVDLIIDILDDLVELPIQLVILGSGDAKLESRLQAAAEKHPDKVATHIGYSESLAHRIEAGVDSFLMPSRFEPCGLNQIYSLRYGSVPIVRRTGGLADTVVDSTPMSFDDQTASGFCFTDATPAALLSAIRRALNCYELDPVQWWKIVITGMRANFSWETSAREYVTLYEDVLRERAATPGR